MHKLSSLTIIKSHCPKFLFYQMKIELEGKWLTITFGIGWIKKSIDLNEIESTTIVKNPWYYGLGIKIIRNGMLYNVHGLQAVEMKYRHSSKVVRVGAPDNCKLKNAIDKAIKQ